MGMKLQYITPLLAAGAAAVAIAAAPTAFATDQQSCNGSGSGNVLPAPPTAVLDHDPPAGAPWRNRVSRTSRWPSACRRDRAHLYAHIATIEGTGASRYGNAAVE